MNTIAGLLLLITIGSFSSCQLFSGNEPQTELEKLPPITQEGKNTFGCLVNGKAFVVNSTSQLTAIYQGRILIISGEIDRSDIDKGISFAVYDEPPSIASYNLRDTIKTSSGYSDFSNYPNSYCQYESRNTLNGELIIDYFDTVRFIISGRFNMTTKVSNCDTIRITDGRFDIQYIP
jgi:hypothetical protein